MPRKKGRPPTPTNILRARGSRYADEPRRRREVWIEPAEHMPALPTWTSPEARAVAPEVWACIEPLGVAGDCDALALAELCEELALLIECRADIREHGATWIAESGAEVQRPHVSIGRQAAKSFRDWIGRFGLTPSDRVGLPRPGDDEPDDDTAARFFGAAN